MKQTTEFVNQGERPTYDKWMQDLQRRMRGLEAEERLRRRLRPGG